MTLYTYSRSIALSSLLVQQKVRGLVPGLIATICKIGYLLLPSRDVAEILLINKTKCYELLSLFGKAVSQLLKLVRTPLNNLLRGF